MSKRKPHQDFAGYVAELRNPYSGGHTVILDCKLAERQGSPLVLDYVEEGGRYQVLCNEHGHIVHSPNLPAARECMKDATVFCMVCRCIAGQAGTDWEHSAGLVDSEIAAVWTRRKVYGEASYELIHESSTKSSMLCSNTGPNQSKNHRVNERNSQSM